MKAVDIGKNGQLSLVESAGLRFWRDLDEQGQAGAGEITSVDQVIASGDCRYYTNSGWIDGNLNRFLDNVNEGKLYADVGNDSDWLRLA